MSTKDWLSIREDEAYSRGMMVERQANEEKDKALQEVMDLLGCDGNTQYRKVPDILRKILDKLWLHNNK